MQSYEEYTEHPKYKLCFFAYNAVRYTVGWDATRSLDSGISSIFPVCHTLRAGCYDTVHGICVWHAWSHVCQAPESHAVNGYTPTDSIPLPPWLRFEA